MVASRRERPQSVSEAPYGNLTVCKEDLFSRDLQIVAGTEDRQRIMVVKPRGSGSEFSLVYVQTRGQS
ncbi:MAG TPA: hypothetical protein VI485_16645 [Vicinamibacterales bacterium]|nr:hypothetical protein [Vicinamibacterales bacterium]